MFTFWRNKRLLGGFIVIIVFIAGMGFSLRQEGGRVLWPIQLLNDTVAFFQQGIHTPVYVVKQFFIDIAEVGTIYEENDVLRRTLAQYARDTVRLNDLEDENKRLKEALQFTTRQMQYDRYTYRIATVISESADRYNRVVKINLGQKDGIARDMAVMTTEGLVGRIVQVYPFSANVQLLTDLTATGDFPANKAIAATVLGHERESFGMIERYDPQERTLIMTKIDQNDPLAVGDQVMTSGLGELFPRGLVIGTVVARRIGDTGLTHMATIRPAARFQSLHEVFVVEVPTVE